MGLGDFLRRLFGGETEEEAASRWSTASPEERTVPATEPRKGFLGGVFADKGYGVEDLARRLDVGPDDLRSFEPTYHEFNVPKRSGGTRRIAAPSPELKTLQRRILRRLLSRLKCHPAAQGFERGRSIVTNAVQHVGKAVVIRMDLRNFFGETASGRVAAFFRKIGWNKETSKLLMQLTTHAGGLPQGAPTSPRLSNLLNYRMDARFDGLARKLRGTYTRYADDLTFSFDEDHAYSIDVVLWMSGRIVADEGYTIHGRRKMHVRRRHQQQRVTGLVVNEKVRLPRKTRRRLRAVAHRLNTTGQASLTTVQLEGWRAFQSMIETQSEPLESATGQNPTA